MFCSCGNPLSLVIKSSNPAFSTAVSNSPFFRPAQPIYAAVKTSCPGRCLRRACGRFSSKTTFKGPADVYVDGRR
jgi:hypothetical protein